MCERKKRVIDRKGFMNISLSTYTCTHLGAKILDVDPKTTAHQMFILYGDPLEYFLCR